MASAVLAAGSHPGYFASIYRGVSPLSAPYCPGYGELGGLWFMVGILAVLDRRLPRIRYGILDCS